MSVERSALKVERSGSAGQAVFLSYASQDAEAAKRICESLRSGGVEVWFDQNELIGGDAWDAKIRKQIKECALFVPIISAATQARLEGYFRIEWKLAAQRTHAMAEAKPFLLPVVIDDTRDAEAHVPAEFRAVQWTRLPGGETPPAFGGRVGALLGGQGTNYSTGVKTAVADSLPPSRPKSRRMLFIAAVVAAVFALGFIGSRVFNRPVTAESAVRVKSSELIARAWAQLNDPALARSHLELANELCQRATTLDPDNADAWAAWSQVDTWYVYHGFDDTPARRDQANAKAARALRTAPGGFEPRLAQACYVTRAVRPLPDDFAKDAEDTLRRLLAERPEEPRVLFALGGLLGRLERVEESAAVFDRMARHPAFAATALSEKAYLYYLADRPRFAEAVEPNERSLAIQPFWGNLALKATLATRWTGDFDAARAAIEGIPASQFTEGVIAYSAWHLHFLRRDPKEMLRILAAVPNDWLLAKPFLAPKAYLSGIAQAMAGNRAAAEAQWGVALQQVGQRLAANPNDFWLLETKAEILARMGDAAAARRTFELARQLAADPRSIERLDHAEALLIGDADRAITNLEQGIRSGTRDFTAASLRLDPDLDRLRGDPRFAALLARAEADPRLAPQPAKTPTAGSGGASPAPDQKSVAVLAFANLSDDRANEYFSDGISEELISVLGRVPGLTVKGSTSAFYFKHKEDQFSSAEIARQLGVTYLVRGSVRKAGDQVRITAQLTRAASDEVVWSSEPLTREVKDVFSVQEEVARLIAQQLQLKLNGTAATKAAVNPEAYQLYLQARQAWNLRNADGYDRAEKLLAQSIALAPDFAPAHAALVDVWTMRGQDDRSITRWGLRNSPAVARITEKSRQAIALDPTSAESHASLGGLDGVVWQWPAGERELREAIRLNPNYASAHQWLGRNLMTQGRLDEALAELKQAAELDPLSPRILDNYSLALLNAQRPAEALAFADRALRLQPNAEQALAMKAVALARLGESAAAAAAARSLPPRYALRGEIALVTAGKLNAAAALLASIPQDDLEAKITGLVGLGRTTEALAALKPELLESGFADLLLFNPVFDPLRNDPRFREVLKTVGLAEANDRAQAWRAAHPPEKLK